MGQVFNGNGVFSFIMQEVETTDDDNLDLLIADYYKHFPRRADDERPVFHGGTNPSADKEVWI